MHGLGLCDMSGALATVRTLQDASYSTRSRMTKERCGTTPEGSGVAADVDVSGRSRWAYEPVVVAKKMPPAVSAIVSERGVHYQYAEGTALTLDSLTQSVTSQGMTPMFDSARRRGDDQYGMIFDGLLDIPADGGYTFTLMGNDGGSLEIDSVIVALSPKPWAQVCGSPGGAVQAARGSIALAAGKHRIRAPKGRMDFEYCGRGDAFRRVPFPRRRCRTRWKMKRKIRPSSECYGRGRSSSVPDRSLHQCQTSRMAR
jgi:hypothetical protein